MFVVYCCCVMKHVGCHGVALFKLSLTLSSHVVQHDHHVYDFDQLYIHDI